MSNFKLMDFGTRRRFSYDVQSAIVSMLKQNFLSCGDEHYKLAHGLEPSLLAHKPMSGSKPTNKSALVANSQREALQAG